MSASKRSTLQKVQRKNYRYKTLIILLHVIQPVARLYGRISHGLTPWRKRGMAFEPIVDFVFGKHVFTFWSEKWRAPEEWLSLIEHELMRKKTRVRRGNDYDQYDLKVSSGLFSSATGLLAVEEHGQGKQFLRFRCRTHYSFFGYLLCATLCAISVFAGVYHQLAVAVIFWLMFSVAVYRFLLETAGCLNSLVIAFRHLEKIETLPETGPVVELQLNGKGVVNGLVPAMNGHHSVHAPYILEEENTYSTEQ